MTTRTGPRASPGLESPPPEVPASVPERSGAAWRYVVLGVLLVAAGLYQAWAIHAIVGRLVHPQEEARAPFRIDDPLEGRVGALNEEARQAGLLDGDRIVAVRGIHAAGLKTMAAALRDARAGDVLGLLVQREGAGETPVAVRLAAAHPDGLELAEVIVTGATGILLPVLSLVLGFTVALLRPRDGRAWLLLLMMMSFTQASPIGVDEAGWPTWLRVWAVAYDQLLTSTWPIWMMLFGLAFPEPLGFDRRHPWIKWLLIVPLAFCAVTGTLATLVRVEGWGGVAFAIVIEGTYGRLPMFLAMIAISTFFATLGAKGGMASSPDVKRRLYLVYWGSVMGLTPMFLVILWAIFAGQGDASLPPSLLAIVLLSLVFFPLSLAYAIVVHRALDVRVVVRQGLQYALASRGVLVLQFIVILVMIVGMGNLGGTGNSPRRTLYTAVGIVVVLLTRRATEGLRKVIDRRFFREAYNAEQILSALSEDVRTIVDTDQLLSTVGQRIASSLHVPRFAALTRHGGAYATVYALGEGSAVRLSDSSAVVARLRESRRALRVDLDHPASWIHREAAADDRRALASLDARLLLPLTVKDDLLGILSLGPKQSEEPYSPSDIRLLQSVAAQTAVALENSRLTAAIAEETALRARMSREIEIAREVQQGLFPQHYPPVAGVEYVGYCRPAQGVGGDYYDFVRVGDSLGIAIGDIAGKGIPAALLMASLQASLRAQAISAPPDLATLMANLNELIYENSPANRYATFFYGQYHPASRRLDYVNAGHNAPLVFRPAEDDLEVLRVDGGGPVIGLLPGSAYTQCSLVLQPGDLFVGYTDGISEALNVADEEWGEERLIAAVSSCRKLRPPQIVEAVLAAADAFCAGARQHDDLTLIVLRVGEG
jgi:sigma-B regulation protein RsbU (phosphoserine phosphatase)